MIQENYVPVSVEKKEKRLQEEKKALDAERTKKKTSLKNVEKNGKKKEKNTTINS